MKKLMFSFMMAALMGSGVGCLSGEGDNATTDDNTAESASALTTGGHYCVSVGSVAADLAPSNTCTDPNYHLFGTSALSFGHPVKVIIGSCTNGHVFVQSLLNTNLFYLMNAASLTPC